jgi:signal transduction histidine kinase
MRTFSVLASAVSAIALALAGLVIGVFNEQAFRDRQAQSLTAQAEVLAATVAPALVFIDGDAAKDVVQALLADMRFEAAGVYDAHGGRLAEGGRAGQRPPSTGRDAKAGRAQGALAVTARVMHEGRPIGLVYVRTSAEPTSELVQRHAGMALLLLMAVIVLARGQAAQAAQVRAARELEARAAELGELNERLTQQIQRRETAEDALRQSQKMETLGQLTGGIAHDFNNLLQTVQGSLDLISRRSNEPAKVESWAGMGLQAVERGVRLTAQLLAFSRSQKLEMKVVDVRQVIARMRDLLPSTLGSAVTVAFEVGEGELFVIADATQLDLAILNLCINARDAMPNGGEIRVGGKLADLSDDPELEAGQYLVLSVTDNGVGMPDDIRDKAFDPFFTTKGVGKGTGLGLAQVYGIAKQAGGVARIESAAGRGTSVSIYLPIADPALPHNLEVRSGVIPPARPGVRILVVDDDAGVRTYVKDALATIGYDCLEAPDGVSGLALLETERIDLLIVDYAMPGLSGAEMASAALGRNPHLPIIFASGYADSAALEEAMGASVRLLRKPFDSETLAKRVAEAISFENR